MVRPFDTGLKMAQLVTHRYAKNYTQKFHQRFQGTSILSLPQSGYFPVIRE